MNELERFGEVTTFVFDVDGVLTNSQLLVMEDGSLLRSMNVRDGYAIKRAVQQGFKVAIITGGKSRGCRHPPTKFGGGGRLLRCLRQSDRVSRFS